MRGPIVILWHYIRQQSELYIFISQSELLYLDSTIGGTTAVSSSQLQTFIKGVTLELPVLNNEKYRSA
jgi:hypothetical protein